MGAGCNRLPAGISRCQELRALTSQTISPTSLLRMAIVVYNLIGSDTHRDGVMASLHRVLF